LATPLAHFKLDPIGNAFNAPNNNKTKTGTGLFKHPDLLALASMSKIGARLLFVRRSLALASLSSHRRFRKTKPLVGELHVTDASAMLIEAYYRALCAPPAGTLPPVGLRGCVSPPL
jgi:hypothetical protein